MLDLLISVTLYLIVKIRDIISYFIFRIPNPNGYKINENNEIEFLTNFNIKNYPPFYNKVNYSNIIIKYVNIPNQKFDIPAIILIPKNSYKVCIIYSHGNSGDIGSCLLEAYNLCINLYCMIISYDYPSYGLNKNKLSEKNVYQNLYRVYEYTKNDLKINPKNIIFYGYSLGTGISFDIATKINCTGLILQAPYLSIIRIIYNIKKSYFFDFFNTIDKIDKLKCKKVLILHGDEDNIVKYLHGRILGYLLDKKKLLYKFITCENKNHNDFFRNNHKIYGAIREYISFCTGISYRNKENENIKEEINDNIKNIQIEEEEIDKNINYNKEDINKIKDLIDDHFKNNKDNNNDNKIKKLEKHLENLINNLNLDDSDKNVNNNSNSNSKIKKDINPDESSVTIKEESIYFVDELENEKKNE